MGMKCKYFESERYLVCFVNSNMINKEDIQNIIKDGAGYSLFWWN